MTTLFDFTPPASGQACRECGSPVPKKLGPGRQPVYCSDECRHAPRICDLCEESYVPKPMHRPGQRWCSKSCKTAWQNGARPPYTRVDREARRVSLARARRLRHAQTWDGIADEEILERDGWRCQIPGCKRRPIRKDLKYPHLRSKSIDHIVPLSHGGDDTAENKRAAHLGCNLARSNNAGDEQVALFGVIREAPLATLTAGERAVMFQRKRRVCPPCGGIPLKDRRYCQACIDRRAAEAEARRALREETAPSTPIDYYTCRYCGKLGVVRASALSGRGRREVCDARECQLARLTVNNMIARKGIPREQADAIVMAYRAEGDHRQWRWSPTINAIGHGGGQGDPDPTGFANDPSRW